MHALYGSTNDIVQLYTGMLILGRGLGLKAKFLGLGPGNVRPWSCLGLGCSGLGIKYKAIHYRLKYGTTDHTMYF